MTLMVAQNPVLKQVFGVHGTTERPHADAATAQSFVANALPYAKQACTATDVEIAVILSQWIIEQGYAWPPMFNNPGNVGDPYAAGQTDYGTVETGVEAYIQTMLLPYYIGVREAVGYLAQCYALGQSPWAGGHYIANGVPGELLVEIIQEQNLLQYNSSPTPQPSPTPVPQPIEIIKPTEGKYGVLNAPIVAVIRTADNQGYTLVGADGGTFNYGDAPFLGSLGSYKLNAPIVDAKFSPSYKGLYLVATDGGVFCFGDAVFHGSTGSMKLNAPVVSIDVTSTNGGYWLTAADGGVFNYGDANFEGSPA